MIRVVLDLAAVAAGVVILDDLRTGRILHDAVGGLKRRGEFVTGAVYGIGVFDALFKGIIYITVGVSSDLEQRTGVNLARIGNAVGIQITPAADARRFGNHQCEFTGLDAGGVVELILPVCRMGYEQIDIFSDIHIGTEPDLLQLLDKIHKVAGAVVCAERHRAGVNIVDQYALDVIVIRTLIASSLMIKSTWC